MSVQIGDTLGDYVVIDLRVYADRRRQPRYVLQCRHCANKIVVPESDLATRCEVCRDDRSVSVASGESTQTHEWIREITWVCGHSASVSSTQWRESTKCPMCGEWKVTS